MARAKSTAAEALAASPPDSASPARDTISARVRFAPPAGTGIALRTSGATVERADGMSMSVGHTCETPCRLVAELHARVRERGYPATVAEDEAARTGCVAHSRRWPQTFTDVLVSLEELAELEADRSLAVEYAGKAAASPVDEHAGWDSARVAIEDLRTRLRNAEASTQTRINAAVARAVAEERAHRTRELSTVKADYESRLERLRNEVRAMKNAGQRAESGPSWFPSRHTG